MSRPQDLPTLLKTWALANYPAGSNTWSGAPQRLAPAAPIVPGFTIPGPVLNYLTGNAFDVGQGALNLVGQMPAMNWSPVVSVGTALSAIGWSDYEQAWYAAQGASSAAYRSGDFGKTWAASTLAASVTGVDIVFDAAGYGVLAGNAGTVQVGTPAAAFDTGAGVTWTNYPSVTSAANTVSLAYDALVTQFFWVGAGNGGGGALAPHIYWSANRTSWTASAIPTTWSSNAVTGGASVGANGSGTFVATFQDTTTTIRTMRSFGNGSNWANDQQLSPGIGTLNAPLRPTFSTVDNLWYLVAPGTGVSAFYSSPDGVTWTLVRTLPVQAQSIAVLGSLIVIVDTSGFVAVSFNKGGGFGKCGTTSGALRTLFKAGGGGILAAATNQATASQRFGLPTQSF